MFCDLFIEDMLIVRKCRQIEIGCLESVVYYVLDIFAYKLRRVRRHTVRFIVPWGSSCGSKAVFTVFKGILDEVIRIYI